MLSSNVKLALAVVLGIATAAIPLFLHDYPIVTFIGMAIAAVVLFLLRPSWLAAGLFLVSCVAGTTGEVVAVQLGVMSFSQPEFFGVPAWLIFTWGNTILITLLIQDYFDSRM